MLKLMLGGLAALLLVASDRVSAFDVVMTDPASDASEDLALLNELRELRPGIRTIVLAPALSSADVIKALRQHVYACFTRPLDYEEVADMARAAIEDVNWRDGIEVTSGLPYWITLKVSCRLMTADRLTRFMTEYSAGVPVDRDLEHAEGDGAGGPTARG